MTLPHSAKVDLTFRGVAHPWMCDAMGHMNVRHYTALFDDCCWHVLSFLLPPTDNQAEIGWAAATMTIEFGREVKPRSNLVLRPAITRIGTKSISTRTEMRDATTDVHYATSDFVSVLFSLKTRTSLALPQELRNRAGQLATDGPVSTDG
jgi:acyl-CoA thioester hydrolase